MFGPRVVLPAVAVATLLAFAPTASAEPVCTPWPLATWCEDPVARAGDVADAVADGVTESVGTIQWKLAECDLRGTTPQRIEEFRACWLDG